MEEFELTRGRKIQLLFIFELILSIILLLSTYLFIIGFLYYFLLAVIIVTPFVIFYVSINIFQINEKGEIEHYLGTRFISGGDGGLHHSDLRRPYKRYLMYKMFDEGYWPRYHKTERLSIRSNVVMVLILLILLIIESIVLINEENYYQNSNYTPKEINDLYGDPEVRFNEFLYDEEYRVEGKIRSIEFSKRLFYFNNYLKYGYNDNLTYSQYKKVTIIILEKDRENPIEYVFPKNITDEFHKGDEVELIFNINNNDNSVGNVCFIKGIERDQIYIYNILIAFGILFLIIGIFSMIFMYSILIDNIIKIKRIKKYFNLGASNKK